MADHTEFVELAVELISEEGRLVTLQQVRTNPSDPLKPWKGSNGATDDVATDIPAVFLPVSGTTEFGQDWIDKELLRNCDEVCLIAPGAVEYDVANLLVDAGVVWKINWIKKLRPATQTILYAMGVAR